MGQRGKVPAIWEKTDLRYLNNSLTNKKVRKVKEGEGVKVFDYL